MSALTHAAELIAPHAIGKLAGTLQAMVKHGVAGMSGSILVRIDYSA